MLGFRDVLDSGGISATCLVKFSSGLAAEGVGG